MMKSVLIIMGKPTGTTSVYISFHRRHLSTLNLHAQIMRRADCRTLMKDKAIGGGVKVAIHVCGCFCGEENVSQILKF